MPLYIQIAFRYLLSIKSKVLSFMTVISVIGIIVGVTALIVTLAIMSGFSYGLKQKILDTAPTIIITTLSNNKMLQNDPVVEKEIKNIKEVVDYEPFVYSNAIASKDESVFHIIVRGVYPEKDKNIASIDKKLIAGDYRLLNNEDAVIIGKDLAVALGVWVGDSFNIISPIGRKTALGFLPKMKKVYVAGIADFGMFEYDSSFVGININSAREFFDMGSYITGYQLKLKDPYQAEKIKDILEKKLPPDYIVKSWMDLNKSLFQALELEKLAMFMVIALIILVASFNISSLLTTKAREKRKDIAILKTIGADNNLILKIFLSQGLIIGLIGTTIGVLLGLSIVYVADSYHLVKLNPDVYLINYLPFKISTLEVLAVFFTSLIICFISSIFPAYSASKENIAEILRYE
ncbi:lipoprotein-releasing ABC transporter permease subunit [Venenivibrio stagnispumantis]|uniref:Lipoprotein-releasing system permease protein n=1 Tax=Venenivibrio stagnispumantis TaxID=407998 RepID=A0AA46AFJ2_9AQUI|nr:ABC transporter permease [Venenivibrio stagnispumantis]MCW4573862.1 ABC transporter permease [Venenivibrio stagnispumantis]SMP19402.1 lipoprotein-releasing system permease protein [Venenivibrio stagnispumantis]